jgi:glycosyltransferase involved in cell wall biosynthesis
MKRLKWKYATILTNTLSRQIGSGLRVLFCISLDTVKRLTPPIIKSFIKSFIKNAGNEIQSVQVWAEKCRTEWALKSILRAHRGCKGIVVLPPLIDWDWMKQRPHHLLQEFARAGYLVFFCSPQVETDRFRRFRRVEASLYLCSTAEVLQSHLDAPIVLATCPDHLEEVRRFKRPRVIYDHLDDLRVHCNSDVINYAAIAQHEELLRIAEVVSVTAERLYARIRQIRPDAVLCPNGVHYDHFALGAAPPMPSDLKALVASDKPIVGYYGALAKWLDYALIKSVAKQCPHYQFVFIGPDYDGSFKEQNLTETENLHWLGEKKYEELPGYVHYFNVATIPFVINEITQCASPIKLFEYLAAGKPIVATDLPECRKYRGVLLARNNTEFVAQLDTAIKVSDDPEYRKILAEEARANAWRSRFELIESQLNQRPKPQVRTA